MKSRLFFCGALIALSSLTGCGGGATVASAPPLRVPPTSFPDQLLQGRARWEAKNLDSYRYTLQLRCLCLSQDTYPVRITVRAGVSDATERLRAFGTLEKVFDTLETLHDQSANRLEVSFTPDGWPSHAAIDPRSDTTDDEYELTLTDVVSLENIR